MAEHAKCGRAILAGTGHSDGIDYNIHLVSGQIFSTKVFTVVIMICYRQGLYIVLLLVYMLLATADYKFIEEALSASFSEPHSVYF